MYQAAGGGDAGWLLSRIPGGWKNWDGWRRLEWMGWRRLHRWKVRNWGTGWWCRWTSPVEVVEVDGMDGVVFQLSSGFHMTGFYWDLGWWHQTGIKVQEERFRGVLEVVGTRYRVQTVDSLGNRDGWWWRWWLQWCWLLVEWVVGVPRWFPNQNVVWAIRNEWGLLKPSVDFGNFRVRLNVW